MTGIHIGDARVILPTFPDGAFNCCVTSPPYFGLRQYLFDGAVQIRDDVPSDVRDWLVKELERRGVKPRTQ